MVNELYKIAASLRSVGISTPQQHPDVKHPRKEAGVVIKIDSEGTPVELCYLDKENFCLLWTLRKGNHNSWPATKLSRPLYVVDPDVIEELNKKPQEISTFEGVLQEKFHPLEVTKWTREQLRQVEEPALQALLDRFPTKETSYGFYEKLATLFLKEDSILDEIRVQALVGCLEKKKVVSGLPVYFDVAENVKTPVASPEMENAVVAAMLSFSGNEKSKEICALTGKSVAIETDKYPAPTLPVGNTYLFSCNKNTACNVRYGAKGVDRYRIGRDVARELQNAITYLTAASRKSKTWAMVPSHISGKVDLLVAYLTEMPQANAALAEVFEECSPGTSYETRTQEVLSALGAEQIQDTHGIELLLLTSLNAGQKQVRVTKRINVEELKAAVDTWTKAIECLPRIVFRVKGKKGMLSLCPRMIGPAEISKIVNTKWPRGEQMKGKKAIPAVVPYHRVLELFLQDEHTARTVARDILQVIDREHRPLFNKIVTANAQDNWDKLPPSSVYGALQALAALSVVFQALNIRKGAYMQSVYYRIGLLLSLVNTLHRQYCLVVRKGEIPTTLLGTSAYNVALGNPTRALSMLSQRIAPYLSWAERLKGERGGLAHWAVSGFGKISATINAAELPTSTNEEQRAAMLLGILVSGKEMKQVIGNNLSKEATDE